MAPIVLIGGAWIIGSERLAVLGLFISLSVHVGLAVACRGMARLLGGSDYPVTFVFIGALLPVLNLVLAMCLAASASNRLEAAGLRVGFFGVPAKQRRGLYPGRCMGCGADIAGLERQGHCRECGKPVAESS